MSIYCNVIHSKGVLGILINICWRAVIAERLQVVLNSLAGSSCALALFFGSSGSCWKLATPHIFTLYTGKGQIRMESGESQTGSGFIPALPKKNVTAGELTSHHSPACVCRNTVEYYESLHLLLSQSSL